MHSSFIKWIREHFVRVEQGINANPWQNMSSSDPSAISKLSPPASHHSLTTGMLGSGWMEERNQFRFGNILNLPEIEISYYALCLRP